ncbi:uncharacterized protein LOC103713578 isoform X2 [Phoenix dactylifera]|uniref:Uncharacterized protein LOC103713578 isoform X2 n=1 Tax=Phoenix dactylifera TaxID=42345 RepID=A0A8B8ZTK0_PHODC|nr:uncharacterized protein LOC103713578 isoform X2 [Phoenix dactylifera]
MPLRYKRRQRGHNLLRIVCTPAADQTLPDLFTRGESERSDRGRDIKEKRRSGREREKWPFFSPFGHRRSVVSPRFRASSGQNQHFPQNISIYRIHEWQCLSLGEGPLGLQWWSPQVHLKILVHQWEDMWIREVKLSLKKYSAEYSKKYGYASTSDAPPRDYDLWFKATGVPTHGHVYGFSFLEDLTKIIGQSSSSSTSISQAPVLYTREDLLGIFEHEKKKWQEEVLQKMREEIGFRPKHADQGSNDDSGSADHASL